MKNVEKNKSEIIVPQTYEAPVITGLEVAVEKGFAGSSPFDSPSTPPAPGHWR